MNKTGFDARYQKYLEAIEDYLSGLFAEKPHWADLYEAMRYSLLSGGKRLRPVLTLEFARLAGEELREKYPERKLFVVDTLCASMGEGLLVWHAGQLKKQGKTIEEVRDWAEENKLHLCHQFTVDDLHFLKRGGRISATTAVVGTMLKIKPVLHVDDGGKLVNLGKARGRKASLKALVDRMEETAIDPAGQTVFISHGDCMEDAEYVAGLVKERMGVQDVRINYVGPVIGAHSGPGTLALFHLGSRR